MKSPNVVFLMVDQLNYRDLGYMKHPVVKTPNLDGLRNDSVAFSRCYVQNAFCLPSRACYLTGQYVFHHREYGFTGLLDERTPCMVKHFQSNGYRTFHVGKLHVNPLGENLGFDTLIPTLPEDIYQSTDMNTNYQVYSQKAGLGYPNDQVHGDDFRFPGIRQALSEQSSLSFVGASDVPSRESIERYTADRAIEFIRGGHDRPFFAHISFDRPHGPWSPSPEYADRYPPDQISLPEELSQEELSAMPGHIRQRIQSASWSLAKMGPDQMRKVLSLYYALITQIDDEIGRILGALKEAGLYDNTVIVFCADHGDMAGHKGLFDKYSNKLYHDEIIRTPLLLKLPGQQCKGLEVSRITESIDLFPTLCELCSVPAENVPLDGSSLVPLTENPTSTDWEDQAFSESYSLKTLVTKKWKLIYYVNAPEGELYDLEADPNERNNLYAVPVHQDTLLQLKLGIIRKMTEPVSSKRQAFIRSLFDNTAARSISALDKLFKWDKGIIEGGGFWMLLRDGYRFTYIPFDGKLAFERLATAQPLEGTHWDYRPCDAPKACHACADELIDYIATKIRPISIMIGSQEERDNMLQTKGHGLC